MTWCRTAAIVGVVVASMLASSAFAAKRPSVASLGKPCKASKPPRRGRYHGPRRGHYCGRGGKLAGVFLFVDGVPSKLKGAGTVVLKWSPKPPKGKRSRKRSKRVSIAGKRLIVQVVTCGVCRRVTGWAFIGDLDRLTDAQLLSVQKFLSLGAKKPLRSLAAWKKHVGSARGSHKRIGTIGK